MSEGAVNQWLKRGRAGGVEALNTHPPTGVKPRLSAEQMAQIPELLAKGARAYGFHGDVWTASQVPEVIARTFGVRYHRDHVGLQDEMAGRRAPEVDHLCHTPTFYETSWGCH